MPATKARTVLCEARGAVPDIIWVVESTEAGSADGPGPRKTRPTVPLPSLRAIAV